jgi:hypothetical protein
LVLTCQQGWWVGDTTLYNSPCGGANQEGPCKQHLPDLYW